MLYSDLFRVRVIIHFLSRRQGLTIKDLKHHYALVPLAVTMAGGLTMVVAYVIRLAFFNTDVSWTKTPEPYNEFRNKQFKFLNPSGLHHGLAIPTYKD